MGELLAITAGCLFGLSVMLAQLGMRQASASAGVMLNLIFSNFVFGGFVLYLLQRGDLPVITWQGVLFAAIGGIAANLVGRTLNYQAVRRIGTARAVSVSLSQTIFAFLFSAVILREIPQGLTIVGILLVLGGVFWLTREQVQRQTQYLLGSRKAGILFALLAGMAFASADLSRKLSLEVMPSAILTSALGGLAALMLQMIIFSLGSSWSELKGLSRKTVLLFLGVGVLGALAILTINAALSSTSMVVVNSLYNIKVWVPIVLGPLILGTDGRISRVLVITTSMILAGTLLIILR